MASESERAPFVRELTDQQWWRISGCASQPVPLKEADVSRPFVYGREWGFFYVSMGHHQLAMATLLTFERGNLWVASEPEEASKLADLWLEKAPGAAFRSSVSKFVQVGQPRKLSPLERRLFGEVRCPFDR